MFVHQDYGSPYWGGKSFFIGNVNLSPSHLFLYFVCNVCKIPSRLMCHLYGAHNMTKLFEFELCKFELLASVI